MSGNDNHRRIHLVEPLKYDDEQTTAIPFTEIADLGGAVLIRCPDGSDRMVGKDEIESVEPET